MPGAEIVWRGNEISRGRIIVCGLCLLTSGSSMFSRRATETTCLDCYRRGHLAEFVTSEPIGSFHDPDPDRESEVCAITSRNDRLWLIESDPDCAGEAGRIPYEPSVHIFIRGSRLPSGRLLEAQFAAHAGSGSGTGCILQDCGSGPGCPPLVNPR